MIHHSHPDGSHYPKEDCPIYRAASAGRRPTLKGSFLPFDGTQLPVEYRAHPVCTTGELVGAICTFVDITDRLQAQDRLKAQQQALEEQTAALQILNRAAAAVAGDLDLERLVQTITDAGVELTGAQFGAFFYNVVEPGGRELHALHPVRRAARGLLEIPHAAQHPGVRADLRRARAWSAPTTSSRTRATARTSPTSACLKGHLPVRSYLAVPVRSRTGEVLGGLFFGHSETWACSTRGPRS